METNNAKNGPVSQKTLVIHVIEFPNGSKAVGHDNPQNMSPHEILGAMEIVRTDVKDMVRDFNQQVRQKMQEQAPKGPVLNTGK